VVEHRAEGCRRYDSEERYGLFTPSGQFELTDPWGIGVLVDQHLVWIAEWEGETIVSVREQFDTDLTNRVLGVN